MNKKLIKILLGICLSLCLIFGMAACGSKNKKTTIVCTIYPQYDWVMQILGDHSDDFDVKYLLSNGVDLHNFQASVEDMAAISSCDLFIYVGGESDEWAEDALENKMNKDRQSITLLEVVEAKEEEIVDGMDEDEHEHEEDEQHEETEYDEHVWLSLRNAQIIVDELADAICALDEKNAADYRANATSYKATLAALDTEYEQAVADADKDTLLFADRFPFRYLVDDYNLNYYAAFAGCSAETEASFDTIIFLANKLNELNLNVILVIETSDKSIAQTVKSNSNAKNQTILVMNSCQSVKSADITNGKTYLSIMTDNLAVLRQALA